MEKRNKMYWKLKELTVFNYVKIEKQLEYVSSMCINHYPTVL